MPCYPCPKAAPAHFEVVTGYHVQDALLFQIITVIKLTGIAGSPRFFYLPLQTQDVT